MTIVGARLEIAVIPYIFILAVIVICVLVATRLIKEKYYIFYIIAISLCMFLQTSLLGESVVGGDVHSEYYVSVMTMQNGLSLYSPQQYNASAAITFVAPFLAKFMGMIWVYKIFFPLCLASVPVIMYFVYKKQVNAYRAFWSIMFFIFVPIMSLEIIGIAKSMIAETFMALAILVMVCNIKYKYVWLPILCILTLLCHYSVGILLILYLIGCFGLRIVGKVWKVKGSVAIATLLSTLVLTIGVGYVYFNYTNAGRSIIRIITMQYHIDPSIIAQASANNTQATPSDDLTNNNPQDITTSNISFGVNTRSKLVSAGIGLDITKVSVLGKVFRIIQYVTQIMIVLGFIYLWKRRKEIHLSTEFAMLALVGLGTLALGIFMPIFSDIVNMTRLYQMSLFFLAPFCIFGFELIWKNKWFMPAFLLIYFLFTSGFVFEITKSQATNTLDLPYSITLSYNRTGVYSINNSDDVKAAQWVAEQKDKKIMAGYGTAYLMACYLGGDPRVFEPISRMPYNLTQTDKGLVFISSWETENKETVAYIDIGLRKLISIPREIYDLPIVFQSGDAIVRERN